MLLLADKKGVREGDNTFYAAVELDRVGLSEKQIENTLSSRGVPISKAGNCAKSAAKGKYKGGCPKHQMLGLCVYKEFNDCWWYQGITKGRYKAKEKDFWRHGWPRKLKAVDIVLYLAIKAIEDKRGYPPGSRLFVAYREIHDISGRSTGGIKSALEGLRDKGLIKLKIGKRGTYWKKGSEVKRVWPIP